MAAVLLSHVKPGDKISENVLTTLGNVLFHKGTVVTPKVIEICQAFLVESLEIECNSYEVKTRIEATAETASSKKVVMTVSSLHVEYDKMFQLLNKAFELVVAGQPIPILELRTQLEKMLEQIEHYNVLTFAPRKFTENDYFLHNSVASALTCYQIAQWTGFNQKEWKQVAFAGLLHDIGNIRIDRSILMKPNSLTSTEKEEMMKHTVLGYQILKNIPALNEGVKMAALQHHERIDGSGYPLGIDASQIHSYAKIVAIADIFHAMTLNKAYRKATSPYLVLEQIQSDAFGKLDPAYVNVFIEKTTSFHNGTVVQLTDNRIGEIVFTDAAHPTRPWVSIDGTIINLALDRQVHIQTVIS